jgi:predicted dehydrogenase
MPDPIRPLRLGVIGTGMMGCEHIRNIAALDGAVVAAISDPHENSRSQALETLRHNGADQDQPRVFHDHRDLLDQGEVDAVIIASPNHTHVDVLGDVLATGVHCLVEKPLCTTVDDCMEVLAASENRSAITWVGLEYRYMAPVKALLDVVHSGSLGELKMLSIREHRFPFLVKVDNWNRFTKNTGGTLVEKCCHFFDLMNVAVGSRPRRVFASGAQDVNHLDEIYNGERADILDNAFVIVDYDNGVRASLDLCMFAEASQYEQEIVAVGSLGKAETRLPNGDGLIIGRRADRSLQTMPTPMDQSVAYEGFHWGASYIEVDKFCQAIRTGSQPEVGVMDGLWSVAVGQAAHRSIDRGAPVEIDDLHPELGQFRTQ